MKIYTFLFYLVFFTLNAQNHVIKVDYLFTAKPKDLSFETNRLYNFIETKNDLLFIEKDTLLNHDTPRVTMLRKSKYDNGNYYNKNEGYMILYQEFFSKPFYIKEQDLMNKFSWEINNLDKQEILGYECLSANLYFRGRDYIAYFTPDIKSNYGPFKFMGLPGLILLIKSKDKRFKYEAFKIEIINDDNFKIKNPYLKKEYVTFKEFKIIQHQKLKNIEKNFSSKVENTEDEGATLDFEDQSMEILMEHKSL